mmetsp:Transcript_20066/g.63991  ORF Transcript_20066/g.63991 Transcript_20066/m.63991 type:complete len:476 (-) Transcript_20066:12-1439(-)
MASASASGSLSEPGAPSELPARPRLRVRLWLRLLPPSRDERTLPTTSDAARARAQRRDPPRDTEAPKVLAAARIMLVMPVASSRSSMGTCPTLESRMAFTYCSSSSTDTSHSDTRCSTGIRSASVGSSSSACSDTMRRRSVARLSVLKRSRSSSRRTGSGSISCHRSAGEPASAGSSPGGGRRPMTSISWSSCTVMRWPRQASSPRISALRAVGTRGDCSDGCATNESWRDAGGRPVACEPDMRRAVACEPDTRRRRCPRAVRAVPESSTLRVLDRCACRRVPDSMVVGAPGSGRGTMEPEERLREPDSITMGPRLSDPPVGGAAAIAVPDAERRPPVARVPVSTMDPVPPPPAASVSARLRMVRSTTGRLRSVTRRASSSAEPGLSEPPSTPSSSSARSDLCDSGASPDSSRRREPWTRCEDPRRSSELRLRDRPASLRRSRMAAASFASRSRTRRAASLSAPASKPASVLCFT